MVDISFAQLQECPKRFPRRGEAVSLLHDCYEAIKTKSPICVDCKQYAELAMAAIYGSLPPSGRAFYIGHQVSVQKSNELNMDQCGQWIVVCGDGLFTGMTSCGGSTELTLDEWKKVHVKELLNELSSTCITGLNVDEMTRWTVWAVECDGSFVELASDHRFTITRLELLAAYCNGMMGGLQKFQGLRTLSHPWVEGHLWATCPQCQAGSHVVVDLQHLNFD